MWLIEAAKNRVRFNRTNRDRWIATVAESLPPGTRVLDAGAGPARYRDLFAHCQYRTQDFCQYTLTNEWQYGHIDYVSDITAIPVAGASFDVVICTEVLEHVPEPVAAIAELNRVLREGGRLFLSAPLGCGLHQEPHHYYGGFTPHFYERFLAKCGFAVEEVTPNGGFFRHLLQEVNRAAMILLLERRHYRWWHPCWWLVAFWCWGVSPVWLTKLDDAIPVADFTVGYHVRARKTRDLRPPPLPHMLTPPNCGALDH